MKELTKEEVLHIAHLGRLDVTEEEITKYKYQLKQILNEIDKIASLNIDSKEIMYSPTANINIYSKGTIEEKDIKQMLSNAKSKTGNFIEVRWLKND